MPGEEDFVLVSEAAMTGAQTIRTPQTRWSRDVSSFQ